MEKKHRMSIRIAACVCAASLLCMMAALRSHRSYGARSFVPPSFEANAAEGMPVVPEDLQWQMLDARAFCVGVCGAVTVTDAGADLWLTNPEQNHVWLKLRILDEENHILGETGLLKPGQYVKTLALSRQPAPGTAVVLKIMAYEPETYYSAGSICVNTIVC